MNTTSVYFFALVALLCVIAALYVIGALWRRGERALTLTSLCLHLPLVVLAFLAEAELRVLFLLLLTSVFLYTLPRFVKYTVERGRIK